MVRKTKASAPSASDEQRDHLPRLGPLEHVARATPAWAAPRLPTDRRQVGCQDPVAHAEARGDRPDRPGVQPGDDRVVDVALGQPASLSAAANASRARGT